MSKNIIIYLIVILLFLTTQSQVSANLLINEFSSFTTTDDWIELYNNGSNDINLSDYCIRDSSKTNKLTLSGTLTTGNFAVFNWGDNLNRSGDVIKIFSNCDETRDPVDVVSYINPGAVISPPDEDQTAGRKTDGGDEWVLFTLATAGEANSAPILPTPSQTPPPSPTPSGTPVPTKIPTPSKMPSPTRIPAAPKSPTSVPSLKVTVPLNSQTPAQITASNINTKLPTKTVSQINTNLNSKTAPTSILGIKIKSLSVTPGKNHDKQSTLIQGISSTNTADTFNIIIVSASVLLLICAILIASKIKKSKSFNP